MPICRDCQRELEVTAFSVNKNYKNGLVQSCRECQRKRRQTEQERVAAIKIDFKGIEALREESDLKRSRWRPVTIPTGVPAMNVDAGDRSLYYTAGLMDAEGSFTIKKQNVTPAVSAYNNNEELLKCVQLVIGGQIYTNYRGEHQLIVQSLDAVAEACQTLLPYLLLKKRQAEILLSAAQAPKRERAPFAEEVSILNDTSLLPTEPSVPFDREMIEADLFLPNENEWSYLGGWVDGDSDIYFQPQTFKDTIYHYPWLHVHSVRPEPLMFLKQRFGGKIEFRRREGKNRALIYDLGFEDQSYVPHLLSMLKPYLIEKKEQIDIVIEASKYEAKERSPFALKMTAVNAKYRGRHKFIKNPDGTYTEDKAAHAKPKKNGGVKTRKSQTEIDIEAARKYVRSFVIVNPNPLKESANEERGQKQISDGVPVLSQAG